MIEGNATDSRVAKFCTCGIWSYNHADSKQKLHDVVNVEMFATQYMLKPNRETVRGLNFAALGFTLWTYQKLRSDLLSQGRDRHETTMYTMYIDEKLEQCKYVRQKNVANTCNLHQLRRLTEHRTFTDCQP